MACGRLDTTRSCQRPVTATSSGDTRSFKSHIDKVQETSVKYRLRCWYPIVESSVPQDKGSWKHICRRATYEDDRRIRNTTGQSGSRVSKVHRNDEKKEHVFEISQTDNKYAIQDDQNLKLSLKRHKQTRAQSDQVMQSRKPERESQKQGLKVKHVDDEKLKMLTSVYMNDSDQHQRHERLLNRIEDIQISDAKLKHAQTIQKQEEHKRSWKRQVDSLREVRRRFDQEQTVRFQTQFVSWKSVEKYRYKKSNNGLPDVLPPFHSKDKAIDHRPIFRPIEREKLRMRNKKRYKHILDPSIGNRRVKTSVRRSQVNYIPDRRNTLVVEDAQQVLFNTELEMSQLDDVSE
ncbi:uncharacterized protein LOC117104852 [Anneissia japonica]|uniref:uncharacterized protein LOC117104852 n=1 Tax=Anneissia japonica TaxID=1529436 RepID=UPI001425B157|nr:uncharacterized protein LOC117104852 [Anneissia japonica]